MSDENSVKHCPDCENTGYEMRDDERVDCPTCKGRGWVSAEGPTKKPCVGCQDGWRPGECKICSPTANDEYEFMVGVRAPASAPIAMMLDCPACEALHVDEGEWATRPHKTHQCQGCGHEWRPVPYATVGIRPAEACPAYDHGIACPCPACVAQTKGLADLRPASAQPDPTYDEIDEASRLIMAYPPGRDLNVDHYVMVARIVKHVRDAIVADTGPGMYECPHCDGTGGIHYDSRAAWLADGKVQR